MTTLKKALHKASSPNEYDADDRLYRAPALEKGLDIMGLLATEPMPLNLSAIVQRLGRSTGELFRMIQVLEHRGFVAQGPDGYSLTTKLFEMGLAQPPVRNLVEIAIPVMRRLSTEIAQSCHLALPSRGDIVVVARMESREHIGFSVRVGYRQPLHLTASGAVLYTYQPKDIRSHWEAMLDPAPSRAELNRFRQQSELIEQYGHYRMASSFVAGITDIAAPVMRGELAAAALCVPLVKLMGQQMPIEEVVPRVRAAAEDISGELLQSDGRV
jgi:DNA-binding IclR family transcriptional regulator